MSEMDQGDTVAPEQRAVTPHSHLPWQFEGNEIYSEPGYSSVAMLLENGKNEANAAFITRAVNSHYALVEALEAMLTDPPATLDEPDTDAEVIIKMREIARAALSAAKGET